MNHRSFSPLLCAAVLSSLPLGCAATAIESAEEVGTTTQAQEAANGLTENALSVNALSVNALSVNALSVNALSVNSLVSSALNDASMRTVLKYLVGCALRPEQSITLEVPTGSGSFYTYNGQLGLYPDWSTGACPADTCQPWVSACVIARINAVGHVVPLSLRGSALTTDAAELTEYPMVDGVFFGNVFAQPQIRYACLPNDGELTRTCGRDDSGDPLPLSGCGAVTFLGPCSSICDTRAADGSFQDCWDTPSPHAGGTAYPASVSVFLHSGQAVP